jgi:putative ATPase
MPTASGVKEVRDLLETRPATGSACTERPGPMLFVDEIHRFNKAQQDVLLPDVEEGIVILIGATTENPFFSINTPLLSRSQIFTFEPLSRENIKTIPPASDH